jgi:hypothetical protein
VISDPSVPGRRFAFSSLLLMAAPLSWVLWIARIKSRSSRATVGLTTEPAAGIGDVGRSAVSMLASLSPGQPLDARFLRGQRMTDVDDKCGCTVRIVVKLRPDQYDQLVRHVREIGSTMSAFLRESAATVMKEGACSPSPHSQQSE